MEQKNKTIERIKIFYIFVFALGTLIITPTHIFPPPAFMYARFPHYLELMGPFFGINWPITFVIYHCVLYVLAIITSINTIGILSYPKLKNITIFSSLFGIFLFSLITLFFFTRFINVSISTAITFGLYSAVLLVLNLLTLKTVAK